MTIKTKLHILSENVASEDFALTTKGLQPFRNTPKFTKAGSHPLVTKFLNAADYVVDNEVVDLLKRDDCVKSIRALCEAGIARLPVSPMVIEMQLTPAYHDFVLLRERGEYIEAYFAMLDCKTNVAMVSHEPINYKLNDDGSINTIVPPHQRNLLNKLLAGAPTFTSNADDANELFFKSQFTGGIVAVQLALLMLNTMGIEKHEVPVAQINKARAKRGRAPIPRHSTVHIGTIYKRDGTAERRGADGGWHMPMHIRQAYTRRQRYGEGNKDTKLVYIPMCIVNYKEGETVPLPKKIVKV